MCPVTWTTWGATDCDDPKTWKAQKKLDEKIQFFKLNAQIQ